MLDPKQSLWTSISALNDVLVSHGSAHEEQA